MSNRWPEILYDDWADTCTNLHLMSQIVGKVRLAHTPWVNHSWHATLYVTPRGLSTGPIHHDGGCMVLTFDLHDHQLTIESADGHRSHVALGPTSIADFTRNVAGLVEKAGARFDIHNAPNELPDAIPFHEDTEVRAYDAAAVSRYHQALLRVDRVFTTFATGFLGKTSPVHLFWGAFDLAVTRFSGREAPEHPGGIPNLPDAVTREAYSHEVSSAGFWPGNGGVGEPMFYSYAYPTPDGFRNHPVQPSTAYWSEELGEFLLPYDDVRTSADPEATLFGFLQSSFEAASKAAGWDPSLDCGIQQARHPRPVRT